MRDKAVSFVLGMAVGIFFVVIAILLLLTIMSMAGCTQVIRDEGYVKVNVLGKADLEGFYWLSFDFDDNVLRLFGFSAEQTPEGMNKIIESFGVGVGACIRAAALGGGI